MWSGLGFFLYLDICSRKWIVRKGRWFFVFHIMVGWGVALVVAIRYMFLSCPVGKLFLVFGGCLVVFVLKNIEDCSCCRFCVLFL